MIGALATASIRLPLGRSCSAFKQARQLNDWLTPPTERPPWGVSETGFVVIIAALMVIAVCGLITTIKSATLND